MKHEDTGQRCLVAHLDNTGKLLPSCIWCSCKMYVRPENWEKHINET